MITRRSTLVATVVDERAGAATVGRAHHHGHAAIIAAAWIETLHSRAQRRAERHVGAA